ncbi:ATP-binding protein [Prochlorothrix hollandica]|uniref:hypothetical protein n=1 Tax=Prochlorothrix hollandica TaxID=1223 RepID=UPI00034C47FD|nr:hypothetical protein [Prochlorothrix hollandica]
MTTNITLDDFYKLFQESERQRQETERILQQSWEQSRLALEQSHLAWEQKLAQEKAAREQQLAEEKAVREQQLAEEKAAREQQLAQEKAAWEQKLARREAEWDRSQREWEKQYQALTAVVDRTSRGIDGLNGRWGKFVENFVEPAVVRLFQARGIPVTETAQRVKQTRGEFAMEIDILAENGDVAVAVEVKSHLTQDAVDEFLGNLVNFKRAFPKYQAYQIYGAVAGIDIDKGVDRYAYRQGLFVIRQSGDTVELANNPQFRPTPW